MYEYLKEKSPKISHINFDIITKNEYGWYIPYLQVEISVPAFSTDVIN